MIFLWKCVMIFFATGLMDVAWVSYTRAVTDFNALRAAIVGVLIYLGSGVSMINIIGDRWLLIPACVGAFVGTYATMKWEARNKIGSAHEN